MRPRARETIHGSHVGTEAPAPFALPPAPEWMRDALCAQTGDPEAYFPGKNDPTGLGDARATCRLCPVAVECLRYALETDQRFGVWGGTTEFQRRKLRKGGAA